MKVQYSSQRVDNSPESVLKAINKHIDSHKYKLRWMLNQDRRNHTKMTMRNFHV